MSDYDIVSLSPWNKRLASQIDALLASEGLTRDPHLSYTCAIVNHDGDAIATGSCFENTLRCFAVSRAYQGEGLLNNLLSHLIDYQFEQGNSHLFLYTKPNSARFFSSLGFYEIARVPDTLVFMENRRTGFDDYLKSLAKTNTGKLSGAIVMNANPFTLGHQYLIETASAACDTLHLFLISEDVSLFPFAVRKKLVQEGIAHLNNVILHDCGPYIISSATFPSYFLKSDEAVTIGQAKLDLNVFSEIANVLGVTRRFAGTEPFSGITALYNQVMRSELPKLGIEFCEIPRKCANDRAISASHVRSLIKSGDFDALKTIVPDSTYTWLFSAEAQPVIEKIRKIENVIHE